MRLWFTAVALSGAAAVSLGALGAHWWPLEGASLERFQLALRFHFIHTLALLAVLIWAGLGRDSFWLIAARWLLALGMVLFCASLYGLALGASLSLARLAPFGGSALILAWLALAIAPWRDK